MKKLLLGLSAIGALGFFLAASPISAGSDDDVRKCKNKCNSACDGANNKAKCVAECRRACD